MKIFRPQPNIELKTVLSNDSVEDLLKAYLDNFKKIIGKTISDIALVEDKLREWLPIDAADSLIPFEYGRQSDESMGNRIWYLSQEPKSMYYNGWFFDYQISMTGSRKVRKSCKLSENAVKFFELYPDVKKHEKPQ